MSRGYRSIILTAFGWLILAAAQPPNNSTYREAAKAAQDIQESLNAIARAETKQADTGEYETPCPEGENNRNSDLCAQWYAATAAGEAANWAYWAIWLGVLSALFGLAGLAALVITIRQGRTANRISSAEFEAARKEAGEIHKLAVKSYDLQFRPKIDVSVRLVKRTAVAQPQPGQVLEIEAVAYNGGSGAANIPSFSCCVEAFWSEAALPFIRPYSRIGDGGTGMKNHFEENATGPMQMGPGAIRKKTLFVEIPHDSQPAQTLYILGAFNYSDQSGRKPYWTHFCWEYADGGFRRIDPKDHDGNYESYEPPH